MCVGCDDGWVFNKENSKCYYVSPENSAGLKTYQDALQFCNDFDATLIYSDTLSTLKYPSDMFNFVRSLDWNIDFFWV